jgi:isopentenyl diphosphate isomerase/L-lactate dehydrogenase-like FMN-dependent dehydrogenase
MGITKEDLNRRTFLRWALGAPLIAWSGTQAFAQSGKPPVKTAAPEHSSESVIASPKEAINVFDLEAAAKKALTPAHFGYLATGVDDDATVRANREGFQKFQLRPKRLVDTTRVKTNIKLFGTDWPTPIILAPVASQRAFHAEGELAVAKAAKARNHLVILSTGSTVSVEDVNAAAGKPAWFQLYPSAKWPVAQGLIKRAEAAGCPIVALTVDSPTHGNRETMMRAARQSGGGCRECHSWDKGGYFLRKPMYNGLDVSGMRDPNTSATTWEFIKRLRDTTSMKIVLKGIVTAEDANLAMEHGVDGIIVSNHGGRGEESGRAAIESLPEVVKEIDGRIPVLVDSGFRRGTDIFKALALGAQGICVGRPYVWGLSAFGQAGVERALDILKAELEMTMRMNGARSIPDITRGSVWRA